MKNTYAPIIVFCYNRLDHVKSVVSALLKCAESKYSDLYVFSDGAKNISDIRTVQNIRNYLHTISGFRSVNIVERKANFGLALNLIDGISLVMSAHGRAIIMEDDIVCEPCFLEYMNHALNLYQNNKDVFTIGAYPPLDIQSNKNEAIVSEVASCWGWATWSDRWDLYEKNPEKAVKDLDNKKFKNRLNINGLVNISAQVYDNYNGTRNTWAVFLNFTAVKYNKFNIYPPYPIITNIGQDGTGTHGVKSVVNQSHNLDIKKLFFPTEHLTETGIPLIIAKRSEQTPPVDNKQKNYYLFGIKIKTKSPKK